jgi:hypothetical protein
LLLLYTQCLFSLKADVFLFFESLALSLLLKLVLLSQALLLCFIF